MAAAAARRQGSDDGGSPARLTAMIVGGVVATVLVAVLAVSLLSGGDDSSPTAGPQEIPPGQTVPAEEPGGDPGAGRSGSGAPAVNRRATNVAVLNGTVQTGLARGVADRLEEGGFTVGTVANFPDQQRSQTIVAYAPGQRRAAQTVAQLAKVGRDAVQLIDRNTQVAAPGAKVVVVVGADQAAG
jgi:hypothetical protein